MDKNNILNKSLSYLFILINIILIIFFFIIKEYKLFFQSKTVILLIIIAFTIPSIKYYFSKNKNYYLPIGEIILIFFILAYLAIFFITSDQIVKSYSWLFHDISNSHKLDFLKLIENNFYYLKLYYPKKNLLRLSMSIHLFYGWFLHLVFW